MQTEQYEEPGPSHQVAEMIVDAEEDIILSKLITNIYIEELANLSIKHPFYLYDGTKPGSSYRERPFYKVSYADTAKQDMYNTMDDEKKFLKGLHEGINNMEIGQGLNIINSTVMSMITRPLLAADVIFSKLQYPLLVTQKIDGVRALKINGKLLSRSFKPIPNQLLQERLTNLLPNGADGEIVINNGDHDGNIYDTTSAVMTVTKECQFIFYWFDWVCTSLDKPYKDRVADILSYHLEVADDMITIIALIPTVINDETALLDYESKVLAEKYEGVILRKPDGRYKCGRSTVSEGLLLKLKRFSDEESTIIGFEELMHNMNEIQYDAFNNIKRRSMKDMLVGGDTLGAIIAVSSSTGVTFKIGSGFSDAIRSEIWNNRNALIGQLVKYKHIGYGVKGAPRSPVFIDIRSFYDL